MVAFRCECERCTCVLVSRFGCFGLGLLKSRLWGLTAVRRKPAVEREDHLVAIDRRPGVLGRSTVITGMVWRQMNGTPQGSSTGVGGLRLEWVFDVDRMDVAPSKKKQLKRRVDTVLINLRSRGIGDC
jgi:hypothetical protein